MLDEHLMAFFGLPGGTEWLIIALVGLLFFGRRLPDIARSVGRSIVEFKRGLHDAKDELDISSQDRAELPSQSKPSQRQTTTTTESVTANSTDDKAENSTDDKAESRTG